MVATRSAPMEEVEQAAPVAEPVETPVEAPAVDDSPAAPE
eukprot:CAMPEP_0179627666 /NCGR_PEP_ID=MMETSP0932-20121108/4457_1 /TAXON_ID=548131 ORGANISM="Ostreococcus mediterraneus, Strain clade-D-RCC2596" /NCGR_SAMPLE_ID=MMETSP0932 /ASSEMBLY_ACC=CAM_ASM_000582 /LENGTH=39 /DNA_ID= /DNA_START= /DNA_END= /DNA_ORIENTATION=